jgi:hypothetical protein
VRGLVDRARSSNRKDRRIVSPLDRPIALFVSETLPI